MAKKKKRPVESVYFEGMPMELRVAYTGCESGYVVVKTAGKTETINLSRVCNAMPSAVFGMVMLAAALNGVDLWAKPEEGTNESSVSQV